MWMSAVPQVRTCGCEELRTCGCDRPACSRAQLLRPAVRYASECEISQCRGTSYSQMCDYASPLVTLWLRRDRSRQALRRLQARSRNV